VLSRLCPGRKAATNEQNAVDVWQLELAASYRSAYYHFRDPSKQADAGDTSKVLAESCSSKVSSQIEDGFGMNLHLPHPYLS